MGWNAGYTVFEATVIGAYDLGRLDKAMLKVLGEPYRNSDIDPGGSMGLEAKDGKGLEQIVIETMGGVMPQRPDGTYDSNPEAWDAYGEAVYVAFSGITREHFGW